MTNDIQIKDGADYGKLCCFIDDDGNKVYGHLSFFMKANSYNPNERDIYLRSEDEEWKPYRLAWKVSEEEMEANNDKDTN